MIRSPFAPLILLAASCAAAPAAAGPYDGSDQAAARAGRAEGRLLPLREIERRVVPAMKDAQYIGFDFDSGTAIYTLKFLRDGSVIWIDVDGRTGRILRRLGQ